MAPFKPVGTTMKQQFSLEVGHRGLSSTCAVFTCSVQLVRSFILQVSSTRISDPKRNLIKKKQRIRFCVDNFNNQSMATEWWTILKITKSLKMTPAYCKRLLEGKELLLHPCWHWVLPLLQCKNDLQQLKACWPLSRTGQLTQRLQSAVGLSHTQPDPTTRRWTLVSLSLPPSTVQTFPWSSDSWWMLIVANAPAALLNQMITTRKPESRRRREQHFISICIDPTLLFWLLLLPHRTIITITLSQENRCLLAMVVSSQFPSMQTCIWPAAESTILGYGYSILSGPLLIRYCFTNVLLIVFVFFIFICKVKWGKLQWTVQPEQCSHNKAQLTSPGGQPANQTLSRPSFHWLTGWLSPLLSAASSHKRLPESPSFHCPPLISGLSSSFCLVSPHLMHSF